MLKQLKIIQVLIIIIALFQTVLTQTRNIVTHKKDGGVIRTSVADIDYITFEETGTVTDVDDNEYKTVKIGDQWWMAENLKVTKYRNGDDINENNSPVHCWAYDNNENNVSIYGRLYSGRAAINSRNIAPIGWHVSTDEDWEELKMTLTDPSKTNQGSKLADNAVGNDNAVWNDGDLENNVVFGTSGFAALPAGFLQDDQTTFVGMGGDDTGGDETYTYFWSTDNNNLWRRLLSYDSSGIARDNANHVMGAGYSVRCVKDAD